ncbi:MAG: PAS domain S-box protein [Chitinophagaceae bacterium]|nr:PAS domain S-box protein [Chitinophagaceae bacterium]
MTDGQRHKFETIVDTLLQIGGRVLDVSGDGVIHQSWKSCAETIDRELNNDIVIATHKSIIAQCVATRKNDRTQYAVISGDSLLRFDIRFLATHPDPNRIFVVVDHISTNGKTQVSEDFWRLALDSSGDGMWDVDVPARKIAFSDRWHSIFGYTHDEVTDLSQWTKLIHPDDIEKVALTRENYFAGETRYYHSEFRLRCSNGNYRWVLSRGVVVANDESGKPLRFIGTHTDIDERKRTEEKYASVAQMLSKLINNLNEGILVTDENDEIIFANQMFCDVYEIAGDPSGHAGIHTAPSLRQRMVKYMKPDEFLKKTLDILKRKEVVLNEEWEMADGRVLSRDFLPLEFNNHQKGGIWKFRDITVQKNTQKHIAELRNFYEKILNSIGADIVVYDANFRYLYINPTAIKNENLRHWLIGQTDEDYCIYRNKPLEMAAHRRRILEKARDERREIEWEDTLVNKNGETEHHLRYMYPVFDNNGKQLYGIGYGLNITDRVKAQEQLKTSMDTFASAFNESGIGMALIGNDGKWLDVNNVLCSMTGYSREELQKISPQDITHPDDIDIDTHLVRQMLKGEIDSYNVEKRYISRPGKIVQILLTVSVVRGGNGEPKFFIAQVVDITDKKEMLWALNKRNSELELTKENLINKIHQLEELSHIIAHNLRGPGGNIRVLSESLLELVRTKDNEHAPDQPFTIEEAAKMIHEGSNALMESLNTLMQITEIKLNKEIPIDNCDMHILIRDICHQLQAVIYEKKAIIRKHLSVSVIQYPKVYLEHILYNLLSNALKYTHESITPEIDIFTNMVDNRVQLTVRDNGLGIDLEKYGHKMFRLNETFHRGFDSKGIGLYITKTQVESYGGNISVTSTPGKGSEFKVTL